MIRKLTGRATVWCVCAAALLAATTLGCNNRTILVAGAEPRATLRDATTYGAVWRSTRGPGLIWGTTIDFDVPRPDGTRGVDWMPPRQISRAAGSHPRLVRVSETEFFAAWREGTSVYGQYLNGAMSPVFPDDPPLRLNPEESGVLADYDLTYSAFDNRILLVTGPAGGNLNLYEVTKTSLRSPPFRSSRLQALSNPTGTRARIPRIATGRPGGVGTILLTAIPPNGGTGDYYLIREDRGTSFHRMDAVLSSIEAHRCIYDPQNERFLEVFGGRNEIFSVLIYPDGSHGSNTRLSLEPFSPVAPPATEERGTITRFSVLNARIAFKDAASTGRISDSVFTFAYSEYHEVVARRYSPNGLFRSSTTPYETVYTQGLDRFGQVRDTRVFRTASGQPAGPAEVALSSEPDIHHVVIVGSHIGAQYAERYLQP